MRKKLAQLVVALTVIVAATFATAQPAQASFQSCPNDRFCIFDGLDGTGSYYYWGPEFYGQCVNIGGAFNDVASSIYNHYSPSNPTHNWQVLVYRDAGCLGGTISCITFWRCYLVPGESMNLNVSDYNNSASSFRVRLNS